MLAMTLALIAPARAARPTVSNLTITGIRYQGTGCPAGSVAYTWTDDSKVFELIFSKYEALLGPGIASSEALKDCDIEVSFEVPDGYEPWVPQVEYNGYAQLDPGIRASRAANYKLGGEPPDPAFRGAIDDGAYQFFDALPEPPCRRGNGPPIKKFKMRTKAELTGTGGTGILDVSETNGGVSTQRWQLALHQCR
jgi:hypothetical protein